MENQEDQKQENLRYSQSYKRIGVKHAVSRAAYHSAFVFRALGLRRIFDDHERFTHFGWRIACQPFQFHAGTSRRKVLTIRLVPARPLLTISKFRRCDGQPSSKDILRDN